MRLIDQTIPLDLELHVICDNSSTHKTGSRAALGRASPAFSHALHVHQFVLAEHGGTREIQHVAVYPLPTAGLITVSVSFEFNP
jgi:hypothetical protein